MYRRALALVAVVAAAAAGDAPTAPYDNPICGTAAYGAAGDEVGFNTDVAIQTTQETSGTGGDTARM